LKQRSDILMIINPASGVGKKGSLTDLLNKLIEKSDKNFIISQTEYPGHAEKLAEQYLNEGIKHFIVAGGDGTLNEVAKVLTGYPNVSMGIIAAGSGNGLARHLSLPKNIEEAFDVATGQKTIPIDVGFLNDKPFLSVAGVGFDAKTASVFAKMKGRGMKNYVIAVVRNYPGYKPEEYIIKTNDQVIKKKVFLVSFANSNQFGGNVSISPKSSLQDGLIDICILEKIPAVLAAIMFPLLFMKKLHKTRYLNIIQAKEAEIHITDKSLIQIDGDLVQFNEKVLTLSLKEKALHIHVK